MKFTPRALVLALGLFSSTAFATTFQQCGSSELTLGSQGTEFRLSCTLPGYSMTYTGVVPSGTGPVELRYQLALSTKGHTWELPRKLKLPSAGHLRSGLRYDAVLLDSGALGLRGCPDFACTKFTEVGERAVAPAGQQAEVVNPPATTPTVPARPAEQSMPAAASAPDVAVPDQHTSLKAQLGQAEAELARAAAELAEKDKLLQGLQASENALAEAKVAAANTAAALEGKETVLAQLKAERQAQETELAQLTARVAELQSNAGELPKVQAAKAALQEAKLTISTLEAALESKDAALAQQTLERQAQEANLMRLTEQVAHLQGLVAALPKAETLAASLAEAKLAAASLQTVVETKDTALAQQMAERQAQEAELTRLTARVTDLQALAAELPAAQAERHQKANELMSANQALAAAQVLEQKLQNQLQAERTTLKDLEAQLAAKTRELDREVLANAAKSAQLLELQNQAAQAASSRAHQVDQAKSAALAELATVRIQLEQAQRQVVELKKIKPNQCDQEIEGSGTVTQLRDESRQLNATIRELNVELSLKERKMRSCRQ